MIAKVRVHGQTQSYPLCTGCLDPVEQVRGDWGKQRKSMVDRFGETSRVGMLIFPASDNQRDGPLAGPLMGDIDSAWPWIWLRSRNTRHSKKCNESFAESLVLSSIHLIIPLGV